MRSLRFLPVVMALLVAGCSGGEDAAPSDTTPAATSGAPPPAPGSLVVRPAPLSFNGTLAPSGWVCIGPPVGQCAEPLDPGTPGMEYDLGEAKLRAVAINLSWSAASPATSTLAASVEVIASCEGCNGTVIAQATGPSPLVVDAGGLGLLLDGSHRLVVRVWNPQGMQGVDPASVYATPEQAFMVQGTASLLAKA